MMKHFVLFFVLIFLSWDSANGDCKTNFLCTSELLGASEYCTQECELNPGCQEDTIDAECKDGEFMQMYDNPKDYCNCCPPKCIKYIKEGDECADYESEDVPSKMCGPRLACKDNKCQPMETNCMKERKEVGANPGMNQRKPECDDDGNYMPRQCTSAKGLCRCVDKETGVPISSGGLESGVVEAEASEMDCQCAQNYHEAIKQGCFLSVHYSDYTNDAEYKNDIRSCIDNAFELPMYSEESFFGEYGHMRCQPNGNYDPIQCVQQTASEGLCFCIDTKSIEVVKNSSLVVFKDIASVDTLFCYDPENMFHYYDYYRPCEMEAKEIYDLKNKYMESDSIYIHSTIPPVCSNDGFYGKIQRNKSKISERYCSDRYGEIIESYFESDDTLEGRKMNCECALARYYLTDSKPKCCENGNYKAIQCMGGLCYCVDEYGRQVGEEVEQTDQSQLECFQNEEEGQPHLYDYCCELSAGNYTSGDFCFES